MPLATPIKPIEHLQFFDGQRLFAADLQDLEEFNRLMRWFHNRSLHQAGVASGYAVSGNKGDSQITVQSGYAIDSQGREIVLTKSTLLQIPPVANDGQGNPVYYDLVVSYPDDKQASEVREGVCVPRHTVRLREVPVFCWARLGPTDDLAGTSDALTSARKAAIAQLNSDIESGMRIRLARAEVLNCQLNQPLSVAERRNARPATQPFVSAGNTAPPATNTWSAVASPVGIKISRTIDTTAAQFRSVAPRYFANVVGDRSVTVTIDGVPNTLLIDGFVRTDNPTKGGFGLSLLIPAILIDRSLDLGKVAAALPEALKQWYVVWMGVEG